MALDHIISRSSESKNCKWRASSENKANVYSINTQLIYCSLWSVCRAAKRRPPCKDCGVVVSHQPSTLVTQKQSVVYNLATPLICPVERLVQKGRRFSVTNDSDFIGRHYSINPRPANITITAAPLPHAATHLCDLCEFSKHASRPLLMVAPSYGIRKQWTVQLFKFSGNKNVLTANTSHIRFPGKSFNLVEFCRFCSLTWRGCEVLLCNQCNQLRIHFNILNI